MASREVGRAVYKNILVPVAGNKADEEAIKLACHLAKKEKGKVRAVYVITVRRSLPLDVEIDPEINKGEEILDHAQRVADEEECRLETDLLQAREAGPAIIDEAVESEADLILMGVEYKRRFGQFSLGSSVLYVFKNAPCRVILYQQFKE
ncbi:MAG: universal stress protein [Chloroflexi bacterium]|nr:universal stress protein [Chloroflexota bacterium]